MQTYSREEQLSMFDPDTWCGRTSLEPLAQGSPRGRTSASSSKKSSELSAIPYTSLDLTPGAGNLLGQFYWEILSPWRGAALMLNTGMSPREEHESFLWQILEDKPHPKYYLTKRACLGILRRASERGKPLPAALRLALEVQAGLREPAAVVPVGDAYHINQRSEGIDLGGISGALMATQNMQMQTFVTQPGANCPDDNIGGTVEDVPAALAANYGLTSERNGREKTIAFAANQRDEVRDLHDVAGALSASPGMKQQTFVAEKPSVLCLNDQGGQVMDCTENITGTLRAQMHSHQPLVFENHGADSRYTGPLEVVPTMSAAYGSGGNNTPLVEQPSQTFCISGNIVDRKPHNGGNGLGSNEDVAFSLTTADRHAVYSRQRVDVFQENEVASTESARQHKDATDLVSQPYQETVGTLVRSDHKGISNQYVNDDKCIIDGPNLIRRLSPLEAERLQGFPDGWTNILGASDSARYKALGNSVAIPCVEFVMRGIAMVLREERRRQGWRVIVMISVSQYPEVRE